MRNPMLCVWIGAVCAAGGVGLADGGMVARLNESGEAIELVQQIDGKSVQYELPLYRAGGVRYFSAGVGLEERAAHYPSFPLKLVFTAGGKPFLAGVLVTIQPVNGGPTVKIPEDRVNGPWLFVDLEPGRYDVTATHGGSQQVLMGVTVDATKQKTVYIRWKEDLGLGKTLLSE